jgi:NADPH2:quinone reductase
MKAVVCKTWGPPDSLVVEEIADLVPGAGQVVVDVRAAGVNFPDVLTVQGQYQVKPALPFTPGNEFAGTVRAVGDGVTGYAPGDRVIGFTRTGAFAEQALAPVEALMPMPPGMDFEIAAAITLTYGTSHHAIVDRGALQPNETMLVLGAAGGVGLAAIEIGKAVGARVIAAASSPGKLEVCKAHGADVLIDYTQEDLREALKAATGGRGPDVIWSSASPTARSRSCRGTSCCSRARRWSACSGATSCAANRRRTWRRCARCWAGWRKENCGRWCRGAMRWRTRRRH